MAQSMRAVLLSLNNQRYVGLYLALVAIALMAIVPFVIPFHSAPLSSFYSEWLALALGFTGCLAFLSRQFWTQFEIPKTALYCLALLLVVVMQSFLIARPYVAQSLIPAVYLVWATLLMVLAVWFRNYFGIERVANTFAWFLLVGALLQAVAGLIQYLGIAGWLAHMVAYKQGIVVYGNIAQANHFATHITLGIIAAIFLYSRQHLSAALAFPLIVFLTYIVALTGSRSVILYAGGAVTLSAIYYFKTREKNYLKLVYGSASFLAAFLLAQYVIAWTNPWLTEQLADFSLNADPFAYKSAMDRIPATSLGWELRTSEWRKAWSMFSQAPILGVGVGNYAWNSFELQSLPEFKNISKPVLFGNAHNIFAQVFAETGLLGGAALVLLIVGWIWQFRRNETSLHTWFIASVLLVLFIHSNLEFPLWYSYFLGIAAFLLGLGDSRTVRITFSPGLGRVGVGLALLLVASTLVTTLNSFREISALPNPFLEPQEEINALLVHGGNPILKPYTELMLVAMMPADRDGIDDKIQISTRQFHRNPDFFKAYRQTIFMALHGDVADAEQLLNKLANTYPDKLQPYLEGIKRLNDPNVQELRNYGTRLISSRHAMASRN